MYDRATETIWLQFTGEPVIGPLAGSGVRLKVFPVVLTTWNEWRRQHKDTTVLSIDTGVFFEDSYQSEWEERSVQYQYRFSGKTMFPVWDRSDALRTKDVVLGVSIGEAHKAYRVKTLNEERVLNDVLGDTEIVVIAARRSQATRVYRRDGRRFVLGDQGSAFGGLPKGLEDSKGVRWQATEDYLISTIDPSVRLERIPTNTSYWFGWYSFHPDTQIYSQDGS